MRKFFHQIHLWLSIPFGLVITIVCLTGAALVFEKELTELFYPDLYYVDRVEAKTLSLDVLADKVADSLPDSVSVTGITVFSDARRTYQVNLSQPRRAAVYMDPYTGEIKGRQERPAFFTCMFKMHRWLLDSVKPGDTVFVGKQVVGISTLVFVIILLSGIAIWIPRSRKAVKQRLQIAVGKGWRRFWYDLHVAGGLYAALLLLAMALTGLTWSYSWYRTAFYAAFGVEMKPPASQRKSVEKQPPAPVGDQARSDNKQKVDGRPSSNHRSDKKNRTEKENRPSAKDRLPVSPLPDETTTPSEAQPPFAYWQQAYERVSALQPDFRQLTVGQGTVSVTKDRFGNQRASDRYTFDPSTGQITGQTLYRDQEASGQIRGWIYSVHVGSWGGLTTRILSFLASLLGGFLPLTGYYLWIKKRRRKRRNTPIRTR